MSWVDIINIDTKKNIKIKVNTCKVFILSFPGLVTTSLTCLDIKEVKYVRANVMIVVAIRTCWDMMNLDRLVMKPTKFGIITVNVNRLM